MCGNLFGKAKAPKVQAVAPAPQAVTQPESAAIKEMGTRDKRQKLAAAAEAGRTAGSSRIVANSLLSQAQSGKKTELG